MDRTLRTLKSDRPKEGRTTEKGQILKKKIEKTI